MLQQLIHGWWITTLTWRGKGSGQCYLRSSCYIQSCLPICKHCSAWEIVGQPQPLLKSAVQQGVSFTLPHLEKLHEILKFGLPARGSGSGKNGSVVKLDYATSLVNLLHPDASPGDKKFMIDCIMGKRISKVKCAQTSSGSKGARCWRRTWFSMSMI